MVKSALLKASTLFFISFGVHPSLLSIVCLGFGAYCQKRAAWSREYFVAGPGRLFIAPKGFPKQTPRFDVKDGRPHYLHRLAAARVNHYTGMRLGPHMHNMSTFA